MNEKALDRLWRLSWVTELNVNQYDTPLPVSKIYQLICKKHSEWKQWMEEHFTPEALGIETKWVKLSLKKAWPVLRKGMYVKTNGDCSDSYAEDNIHEGVIMFVDEYRVHIDKPEWSVWSPSNGGNKNCYFLIKEEDLKAKGLIPITLENYKEATLKLWKYMSENEQPKDMAGCNITNYKNSVLNKLGYKDCYSGCPLCEIFSNLGNCTNCPLGAIVETTRWSCYDKKYHYKYWEHSPTTENARLFYEELKVMFEELAEPTEKCSHYHEYYRTSTTYEYCPVCGIKLEPPKPEPTLKSGDRIKISEGKYIIAFAGHHCAMLIVNLLTGGNWRGTFEVKDSDQITKAELDRHIGEKWEKVE